MPKRSPEYMESQRLRFCEAATACFRRKGVVATNLNDICEEAGLSMGALYKHFTSRDDLLEAMQDLRFQQRNQLLRGDTWPRLRAAMLQFREESAENPFWREFQGVADWNPRMREQRIHEGGIILAQIEQQLQRYADAGEIKPPFSLRKTAQLLSVIIDGSMIEVRLSSRLGVGLDDLADYLDHAVGAEAPAAARLRPSGG